MKTKIIIFLISIFPVFMFSQSNDSNYENDIRKALTSSVDDLKSKDTNASVEYIYPKYFSIVSKAKMIQILNFTYNNPAFLIDISEFKIDDIEKPELINGEYFSMTNYSFKIKLTMQSSFPNAEQLKPKIKDGLYKKYGQENVQYNPNGDFYTVDAKMKACAISNNGTDWKFLIIENNSKSQLSNILPEKILDEL